MIYDVKKLSDIIEENQRRIDRLEKKIAEKTGKKEITEIMDGLVGENIQKNLYFNSTDGSGCLFVLELNSESTGIVICDLMLNGVTQKSVTGTFPITVTLPFLPVKGENQIGFWLVSESGKISVNVTLKVVGNLDNGVIDRRLGVVGENYVYYKSGDSFQILNAQTGESVYCVYGIKTASAIQTDDGNIVILTLPMSGNGKIFKLNVADLSISTPLNISTKFTDCALKNSDDGVVAFILIGNGVSSYLYANSVKLIERLPIRAKKIGCLSSESGEYFYYIDTRDNVTVLKTDTSSTFVQTGSYSLGKKSNFILNWIDESLKIFYSTGEITVMRSIGDLSDITPLGNGSQGIKCNDGKTFLVGEKLIII